MSLCINPNCTQRQNHDDELFCVTCGSELLLKGRYRVMRHLGGGGFGLTFEVNEVRSNIPKVLKVLINTQQKAVELFQQEAEVLSQLDNPGIPQVEHDGYFIYFPRNSQDPIHCLVMEKIVGMDLQKYMENRSLHPIDQNLAIQWLKELVTILDDVHSQNFFHRDIKPPNIMLRATGELTLIDFGTARQVTATVVKQQGGVTMISSAGYTPVEQINSQAVPQSDFFALGRTFVFLLTGKYPLDAEIYDAHNDELDWRSHAPNISPLLADLLDEMMAHKPKQRPANTQVILQRLAQIKQALNPPKVTRRTSPPQQPVDPLKPKPPTTIVTSHKPVGWSLWRQWMLANTMALLVWLFMFYQNRDSGDPWSIIILIFILPITLLSVMQWLILRQLFPCKWWMLLTVLGTALGMAIAIVLGALLMDGSNNSKWVVIPMVGAAAGASLGLMQWFVLKRQVALAGWWIFSNALGVMIVFYALTIIEDSYYRDETGASVFGGLAFTVFGAITGGTMVRLMRQPAGKS
jgi:serine/threonine protein kinase